MPLALPALLFCSLKKAYYRQIALKRLGFDLNSEWINLYENVKQKHDTSIPRRPWIHALSLGEVNAAATFIREMEHEFSNTGLILSATTQSGLQRLNQLFFHSNNQITAPPFDVRFSIKRFIRVYQPSCLIIIETDLWPNWIWTFKQAGIPVFLINGSISSKATARLKHFKPLAKLIYSGFEAISMQSDADKARLIEIGIERSRVNTMGNLKFDCEIQPISQAEKGHFFAQTAINPRDPIWIAGSTHEGEEIILLDVHLKLKKIFPKIKLIIAPRHTERSEEIAMLARKFNLSVQLLSSAKGDNGCDVIIVDTIGKLARLYGVADVAFVGGSLVPVGGHSLLEPAQHKIPVFFGSYVESCQEIAQGLIEAQGGFLVNNGEVLFERLKILFANHRQRTEMGNNALGFANKNKGVVTRHVAWIKSYITKK